MLSTPYAEDSPMAAVTLAMMRVFAATLIVSGFQITPRAPTWRRRCLGEAKVESLDLEPIPLATGVVRLPGSKSLSNRALLLAALCEGETFVENVLDSDDTERMLEALGELGIWLQKRDEGRSVLVRSEGVLASCDQCRNQVSISILRWTSFCIF